MKWNNMYFEGDTFIMPFDKVKVVSTRVVNRLRVSSEKDVYWDIKAGNVDQLEAYKEYLNRRDGESQTVTVGDMHEPFKPTMQPGGINYIPRYWAAPDSVKAKYGMPGSSDDERN